MKTPAVSSRWVYAVLIAYASGFLLFWPRSLFHLDEAWYVTQAVAFARGDGTMTGAPPGTALLQAPLVGAFGLRAAPLVSLLALIVATLATARWLRDSQKPPAFALLIPGFAGAALVGRFATSDAPSIALAAVACMLIWRASPVRRGVSFAAGLCVGATLLFREPLVPLLGALLVGALVRGTIARGVALGGVAAGVAVRLAVSNDLFGSGWNLANSGAGVSFQGLGRALPAYALILLILAPMGALLPVFYRGDRRAELRAGVAAYIILFLVYEYNVLRAGGTATQILLESRFIAPAMPVLAFMAADVWPRWVAAAGPLNAHRIGLLSRLAAGGVLIVGFALHPALWRKEGPTAEIIDAFRTHASPDVPLITNTTATHRYASPSFAARALIHRYGLSIDSVAALRAQGPVTIAFLNRTDNERSRAESRENAEFLASLSVRCDLRPQFSREFGMSGQLEIHHVTQCR